MARLLDSPLPPVKIVQNLQNIGVSFGPRFFEAGANGKSPGWMAGAFCLLLFPLYTILGGNHANYFLRVSIGDKGVVGIFGVEGA